jgi:hypothetical protein
MAAPWAWLTALVVALAVVTAAAGTAGTSEQRRRQMRSLLRRLNKDPLASIQEHHTDPKDQRGGCAEGELYQEVWEEESKEHPKLLLRR